MRVLLLLLAMLLVPASAHAAGAPPEGAHGEHHAPTLDDVNWYHGFLAEKEGVEPGLLFRPTGMPAPYLGYVLNAALLYGILYFAGRRAVKQALEQRKANIERGMSEAARLKKEAASRLLDYEEKLRHIDEEVERVKREMREAGEAERARILAEARTRRERMERDARLLVEQELAEMREQLIRETVSAAVRSAASSLQKSVTPADHARLADEYLAGLGKTSLTAPGGG